MQTSTTTTCINEKNSFSYQKLVEQNVAMKDK